MIHVIHLQRKAKPGFNSIERVFADIRAALPAEVKVKVVHSWFDSKGFWRRSLNLIQVLTLKADVIHITGDVHYLALGCIGKNLIVTVHDLALLHEMKGPAKWVYKFFWFVLPLKIAEKVTVISEFTRQDLCRTLNLSPENIPVIHNPVSPAYTPSPKRWPDLPTVLMVGTKPNKNLERMFEALREQNVTVKIIGTLTPGQRQIISETQVPFEETGHLSFKEVVQTYRDCDLLAFVSSFEGFGLPILEAQATGRPVVTSNISSMQEVGGGAPVYVNPEDSVSIREGFRNLLLYPKHLQNHIEAGLRNVQRFQSKEIAACYLCEYKKLQAI